MVIYIKKFFLIILLFLFNIIHIDSNSTKNLFYDDKDPYYIDTYTLYFKNTDTKELKEKLSILDINVLNYIINEEKYYARNIDVLEENYLKDKPLKDKIYYEEYGIKIDAINVACEVEELIKLQNIIDIY